jgi:hypothetical protein
MTKELGIYTIHSNGQVYSNKSKKFLKPIIENGYYRVGLSFNGKSKTYKLHRLIAECFIEKVEGKTQINHKDCNKLNNDVSNLEWCNNSENQLHAYKYGLNVSVHKKVVLDIETGVFYDSATELANLLGMNKVTLIGRLNGTRHELKRYKYA